MRSSLDELSSSTMDPINPHCEALASPDYKNFGVSLSVKYVCVV